MSVSPTSIEAYHDLIREKKISPRAREVLDCLMQCGPLADYEIAARLNKHPSQISARRGDLVNELNTGIVVFTGHYKTNPITRKKACIWRANVIKQPTLL